MIDVTGASAVRLAPGDQLEVDVSIANFARNNPDAPVPTQLWLQLLAPPDQGPLAVLPGSTAEYYSGFGMQGEMLGQRGGVPFGVPFVDTASGPGGNVLLLRDGSLTNGAGTRRIGIVNGGAGVDAATGAALFGPTSQNIVRILLTNVDAALWVGAGDGYTLRTSLLLGVSGGSGSVQTTGLVENAWLEQPAAGGAEAVPDANSGALVLGAALLGFGYYLLSRAWKNLSSKNGCTITSSR